MRITSIGGGTGGSTLARGHRRIGATEEHEVTAIVSMADSGGYSGYLRNEKGVLPPGDIMKLVLAFSHLNTRLEDPKNPHEDVLNKIIYWKFKDDGSVPGHDVLTARAKRLGFLQALAGVEEWLECSGKVLPVTLDEAILHCETTKRIITGEGEIEKWLYEEKAADYGKEQLLRVFLEPRCCLLEQAREAIDLADLVVIGPGSFQTSQIACLDVKGMREVLHDSRIAYIVNITTHPKETPDWTVSKFVKEIELHIRRKVDVVICNTHVPEHLLDPYGKEYSSPVIVDAPDNWNGRQVIKRQLVLSTSTYARHDPERLARVILELLE